MIGLVATLAAPPIAGSAPIDDLKAKAAAIEDQIEANGAKIAALGEQLNAAQIKVNDAEDKIADADARTKAAEDETNRLRLLLSQRAADLYKAAGGSGPFDSIDAGDTNEIASQRKYSEVASGRDDAVIGQLAEAKDELARQRAAAEEARQDAATQRDAFSSAKAEANAAQAKQENLLKGVQGEIAVAVEAERKAREAAAAAAAPKPLVSNPSNPNSAAARTSGGGSGSAARGPSYNGPPPSVSGGAGAAVGYAQAQVGKPYCYAGTGPDCYDCSGLTMMAWRQGGISLPHFSGAQAQSGPHVPLDQLQPGDLVTTSSWGAHVGIWVGGGYVHATHTGDFVRYVPGLGSVVDAVRPQG
jgi:cell wall-associated NlpC family hydrolase